MGEAGSKEAAHISDLDRYRMSMANEDDEKQYLSEDKTPTLKVQDNSLLFRIVMQAENYWSSDKGKLFKKNQPSVAYPVKGIKWRGDMLASDEEKMAARKIEEAYMRYKYYSCRKNRTINNSILLNPPKRMSEGKKKDPNQIIVRQEQDRESEMDQTRSSYS
mmetsp:Transcript_45309/g.52085  ORF Transcript_45309/g.52085 Transcript_45309/m.52085 type:complete len:162 (-) Transcript_45309:1874-2359(-)